MDMGGRGDLEDERGVISDNELQAKYLPDLATAASKLTGLPASEAFAACLKFRLPFTYRTDEYEYIDGIIRTQPWTKFGSAETRLWVIPKNDEERSETPVVIERKTYSRLAYEQVMAFHNVKLRSASYNNLYSRDFGDSHDSCHDCNLELQSWLRMCKSSSQMLTRSMKWKKWCSAIESLFGTTLQAQSLKITRVPRIQHRDEFKPYYEILLAKLSQILRKSSKIS